MPSDEMKSCYVLDFTFVDVSPVMFGTTISESFCFCAVAVHWGRDSAGISAIFDRTFRTFIVHMLHCMNPGVLFKASPFAWMDCW